MQKNAMRPQTVEKVKSKEKDEKTEWGGKGERGAKPPLSRDFSPQRRSAQEKNEVFRQAEDGPNLYPGYFLPIDGYPFTSASRIRS